MGIDATNPISPIKPNQPAATTPKSSSQQTSPPPANKNTPAQTPSFFDKVKGFFKPVADMFGVIFGISMLDDKPYLELRETLKKQGHGPRDKEDPIEERAKYLLKKSEAVVELGRKNILSGKDPWEGLTLDMGVPMSASQQFLAGGSEVQNLMQHYYYNCEVYSMAGAYVRGELTHSFTDIDNTRVNKNLDPEDTARFESEEVVFWGDMSSRLAQSLGIKETALTARAPFDTLNGVIPEALDESLTYALLNGGAGEMFGLSEEAQLEGLERTGLNVLNGSVKHEPGEPVWFSSKVMRLTLLQEFFESADGPRFDGKTFTQALVDLVRKNGCCYFEPKGIPRYLIDTYRATGSRLGGEVYLSHYIKIIKLKKDAFLWAKKNNKSEKDAWNYFAETLRKDVEVGIPKWQKVDAVKAEIEEAKSRKDFNKVKVLEIQLQEAREEAYKHVRLAGADKELSKGERSKKEGFINYYNLICKESEEYNPQAFFEKSREGILLTAVVHFINRHGTPIEEVPNEVIKFLNDVSCDQRVRRYVARLNHRAGRTVTPHPDIQQFVKKGISIFKNQGVPDYLNWRLIKYFADNYTKSELENIKFKGQCLFDFKSSSEEGLDFSKGFKEEANAEYQNGGFRAYRGFINEKFVESPLIRERVEKILPVFLPQSSDLDSLTTGNPPSLAPESYFYPPAIDDPLFKQLIESTPEERLENCTSFYPNEMFGYDNTTLYGERYLYNKIMSLVLKQTVVKKSAARRYVLDPHGQYYLEIAPGFGKECAVPHPVEAGLHSIEGGERVIYHAAGDSKADTGMLARALESGGYADIVFHQVSDLDLYDEIIKQRLNYVKDIKEIIDEKHRNGLMPDATTGSLYQQIRNLLGEHFFALEEIRGTGKYKKVTGFDPNGNPLFDKDVYDKETIVNQLREVYRGHGKIIRNTCPEAYLRRRAEVFGLLSGENIELNLNDFKLAESLYTRKEKGENLTEDEQDLLRRYERLIVERREGLILPEECPRFTVRVLWLDENGNRIYRSRSHGGKLFIYNEQSPATTLRPYEGKEGDLASLKRVEVFRNDNRQFVYVDKFKDAYGKEEQKEFQVSDSNIIDDCVIEDKFIRRPPKPEGPLTNKTLVKIFGEKKLRSFVCNLPNLFHNLLKYSGVIMALGGIVRILSPVFGGLNNSVYKIGYWMSNGLRAISAAGGGLRGELNVHKYHTIAGGEVINIISSFLPNGIKHLGLGLGNFVLFLGRGLQTAQRGQRVNSHIKEVLTGKAEPTKEVDPRPFVRKITKLATGVLLTIKEQATKLGISGFLGEVTGNISGAVLTTIQFMKDIFKDPRLIFQWKERMSEKSGSFYRAAPSPGHLLTLVGALSGISAVVAGIFGRMGEKAEENGGFNLLGKLAISFANAIPAIGIIANAKEVASNPGGLPRIFKGLNGKDIKYDPMKAGLRQIVAGLGFLLVPWGGLHNKYVASLFDMFNGMYFLGAAEEEKPNTTSLGINILRKAGTYTNPDGNYKVVSFKKEAA